MTTLSTLRTALKWLAVVAGVLFVAALGSFVVVSADQNPLTTNGLPLYVLLGVALVSWIGVVVVDFYRGTQTPTQAGSATDGAEAGDQQPTRTRDPKRLYLQKFRRSNLAIGVLLVLFVGSHLLLDALVRSVGSGTPLTAVDGFLTFAVRVFGGVSTLVVVTALFLGIWYGLRREASEALVAGIVAWGLIGLVGLSYVTASTSGFGLVIGGLFGVYYGVRARGATEPRFFTSTVEREY